MKHASLMGSIIHSPHYCLAIVLGVSCLSLTACETVETVKSVNYQGATKPQTKKSPKEIAQVRTSLAAQYIRQKKLDPAQRQLELAFKADKRYAPAYNMMGVLLQQEGSASNLAKADHYFKKAIRLDSKFIQAHNNYGVYLSKMNRYQDAVKQFEIAGSALGYSGRTEALENLGRTYLKINNNAGAIQAFTRALENNPNSLVSRIELVDILIATDKTEQARRYFEEVKFLLGKRPLGPRVLLQGAKLAHWSQDRELKQKYISKLFSLYPLSQEARKVKKWLREPNASWR